LDHPAQIARVPKGANGDGACCHAASY